ncbi:flavin reductase family protein [Streptomyces sp. G5(2025)]|uniref:flavin reductase family protein n=1 Tax=Streptomyces sp. G5(2025) TaxID=3406628 RepID=UPI003C219A54
MGVHRAARPRPAEPSRALPPRPAGAGATGGGDLGPRELRGVFGRFATGVTVVTAGRDEPRGMTANSFTSVSLTPPQILVCVLRDASMHRVILEHHAFGVSVLSERQERLARHFADSRRPRGAQEFATVDVTQGPCTGVPVLGGSLAWFECGLAAVYDGGDHSIFLGDVLHLGHGPDEDALLFYAGAFRRLEGHADRRGHLPPTASGSPEQRTHGEDHTGSPLL